MAFFGRMNPFIVAATAILLPIAAQGCSAADSVAGAGSSICCKQFQPGTDMLNVSFTANASLNGQFQALAQATGDMTTLAGTAISDITAACQGIATDLGADPAAANDGGLGGTDLANFWCGQAKAMISANLTGTLAITFTPPECSVSVQAQANCQAHCNVNGSCDVNANPPKCMGGTLEVACSGSCDGSVNPGGIDCSGTCSGECTGSCTAQGGVQCAGKCDGTCSGSTDSGGNCMGMCKGTCHVTAPSAMCGGSCSAGCKGMCTATEPSAKVSCSGGCKATATPLSCKGGTLQASCNVDANCQANCNASASAKADCTPPSVSITGAADVKTQAVIQTLTANLPKIAALVKVTGPQFTAQFQAVLSGSASIATSSSLDVGGLACGVVVAAQVSDAVTEFTGAVSAATTVTASIGM